MCPAIDNPTSCEIRTLIRLLRAKNISAAEIRSEFCTDYSQNVMSEGTIRQWCRIFKDGRTNIHDYERSGRPSVVSDG
jgi:transposase